MVTFGDLVAWVKAEMLAAAERVSEMEYRLETASASERSGVRADLLAARADARVARQLWVEVQG